MGSDSPRTCTACAAALDPDQRYCLQCGERNAQRSPALLRLLARVSPSAAAAPEPGTVADAGTAAQVGQVSGADAAVHPPGRSHQAAAGRLGGLRLPSRPVSAVLVLLFLGFGLLLGNVTGSPPSGTLAAAAGPRLKLYVAPTSPPGAAAAGAGETEASPPPVEAEETPEAAETAETATSKQEETVSAGGKKSANTSEGKKSGSGSTSERPASKLPAVKHVFLIVLSGQPYAALFGPESSARYLSRTLEKQGELLVRYDAVAHEGLADEIALVSGQGPTAETAADCPSYNAIVPGAAESNGQVLGEGCVYPAATQTIASQLEAKHLSWRAYIQGVAEAAGPPACSHPALGQPDPTSGLGTPNGPYSTALDPFMYFGALTGSSSCAKDAVGLSALKADLGEPAATPSFSYIAADRCDDASPLSCTPGAPAGPAQTDAFLKSVVPEITASKAYKQNGLLVITGDEAPSTGEFADSSSCCGQPAFPNLASTSSMRRGGGSVGALLLSPFVKPASTNQESFNHFGLLRTIEDLFGLAHLGYAAASGVQSLPPALFVAKG
jgi:hypothetical protein